MKHPPCLVKFAVAAFLCLGVPSSHAERLDQELSTGWKFIRQPADLGTATDEWEKVSVPHTWNAIDVKSQKNYFRGEAWYARPLDIPKDWKGKRVFIRFESAMTVADSFINGQSLGEHRGGYTAFCYELTPFLRYGASNELRVRVNNAPQPDVAPISGDFNIGGGLCRPVSLIVTDSVCVTPMYFASPGVFISTKELTDERAEVEIKTMVSNGAETPAEVEVETEIRDREGKPVAKQKTSASIPAGQTAPVLGKLDVSRPHLWNGLKDPYLYAVNVRVLKNNKVADEIQQPLGLRTVKITEEQGFLLNGKSYPVHGVNRHQDRYDKGAAVSKEDHQEDIRIMLEMGVTAVRLAHYPQAEYFYGQCDRNGLLLWGEVPMVDKMTDTPEFRANAEQQLREMVFQRFNHPSAVFWGLFNELANGWKKGDNITFYNGIVEQLNNIAKELDSSRIVVAASCHGSRVFNKIPDRLCFNQYPGWYQPFPMSKYIERWSTEVGKRVAISEYGAGGNPARHQEGALTIGPDPKDIGRPYHHTEEWQTYVHEEDWKDIKDNPKLWGSFIWVMFDFASSRRNEGGISFLNNKGMVTWDRKTKKDAYYFYKANWNPEPMVYITSRRMTQRIQASTEVKAYSNAPEVELKINGKSLGSTKPDAWRIARWPSVVLQPGKNQVEVFAVMNGKKLSDTCTWELSAGNIESAPVGQ